MSVSENGRQFSSVSKFLPSILTMYDVASATTFQLILSADTTIPDGVAS